MWRKIIPFLIGSLVQGHDKVSTSPSLSAVQQMQEADGPLWDLLPVEMKGLIVSHLRSSDLPLFELVNQECQQLALKEREKRYTPSIRISFLDPVKSPISDLIAVEINLIKERGELWKSYFFPYAQKTRLVPLGCAEDFTIQLPYDVLPLAVTIDFIARYGDEDREIFASWYEPVNIGTLSVNNIFYKDAGGNKKSVEAIRFTPKNILFKRPK